MVIAQERCLNPSKSPQESSGGASATWPHGWINEREHGTTDAARFLKTIVRAVDAISKRLAAIFEGRTVLIRQILDTNDLVCGLWQDWSKPNGVGSLIIKAETVLRFIMASEISENLFGEHAYALREVFKEAWNSAAK